MITKNYIKMCEEAKEIQKSWNPKFRDYCREKEYKDLMLITQIIENHDIHCFGYRYRRTGYGAERYLKDNLTWLPTQEQLQEMIKKETYRLRIEKFEENILIECFFKNKVEGSYYVTGRLKLEGNNYQELLLRIVMYRKYSKTWTGEKWAKAE